MSPTVTHPGATRPQLLLPVVCLGGANMSFALGIGDTVTSTRMAYSVAHLPLHTWAPRPQGEQRAEEQARQQVGIVFLYVFP